ncbi:MAG: response regulator transcription factor [Chloroflexi bacterium]|nr:response regulator transcription factor [Chloroflexota bacterium]
MAVNAIRVLIADDHTLFRQGLSSLLQQQKGLQVVGEAVDGWEALAKARELQPHLVLMDVAMPRCNGLEATRLIKRDLPDVNIIMLTVSEKDEDLFAAIKAGAKGYLLKNAEFEELVRAIEAVAGGAAVVSPSMAVKLLNEFAAVAAKDSPRIRAEGPALTERETEVLQLLAKGATNKEIANTLVIAENTVKTHLRNILDKLHLHNRIQAAAYAIREGLAPEGPPTA